MKILAGLFFIVLFAQKADAGSNYEYLLKIINNELSEVSRLNKQIKASDDTLLLRMANFTSNVEE